ncbi:SDR family NAD(P)-dependent oxidoreductase [Arcobacter lacus]|uniref:Daunorubicin C-13 ketoreductase n=1 Tax=Arcobacter lacus TaxID=1912876 RepID=A0ABX5JL40_9BACT|nr:SDR family NAD(P)-dependent oxidoreductase [Arcobacter lacus]PUE64840.1 hypothetical protein B0175_10560 [Arcobacter lacus]
MLKVFITGSSDGLGLFTAQKLINLGHEVTLHAKTFKRAEELSSKIPKKTKILVADLSKFEELKQLAHEVNDLGRFDVIIHNAGIYDASNEEILKVNVLAPYILTALINKPKKLIYIGSNMHPQGKIDLEKLHLGVDYSTSKLLILMLSFSISKLWSDVYVNTVDPGWVKTKMANYNAPDSLEERISTQLWLTSDENLKVTGKYFHHLKEIDCSTKALDKELQEKLLNIYKNITTIHI